MSRTRTAAGVSLFLGAGLFWLVNTVAEASFPGYSVKADALSRLGSVGAPTQGLWDGALLILGATWLVGMALLFRGSGRRVWRALNLVPGITVLLVAVFPAGSIAAVHGVAAYATFLIGGVVAVADFQFVRSWFRYVSLALGATTLGCLVLGPLLAETLGFGGTERLVAYPILAWLMGFGSQVMAGSVEVTAAKQAGRVDRGLAVRSSDGPRWRNRTSVRGAPDRSQACGYPLWIQDHPDRGNRQLGDRDAEQRVGRSCPLNVDRCLLLDL